MGQSNIDIILWAFLLKFFKEVGYCDKRKVVSGFRKFIKTQTISKKRWSKRDIRVALKSGVFTTFTLPDERCVYYTLKDENTSKHMEDARRTYAR